MIKFFNKLLSQTIYWYCINISATAVLVFLRAFPDLLRSSVAVNLETIVNTKNEKNGKMYLYFHQRIGPRYIKGQVSVWQSATLLPKSCKSVQPVPARVLTMVMVPRSIHPFPRCRKPARRFRLSKLAYFASSYSAAGGEHDHHKKAQWYMHILSYLPETLNCFILLHWPQRREVWLNCAILTAC